MSEPYFDQQEIVGQSPSDSVTWCEPAVVSIVFCVDLQSLHEYSNPFRLHFNLPTEPRLQMNQSVLITAIAFFASTASADDFVDDFSQPTLNGRLAERGTWRFSDDGVSCVADLQLYKKFKNHGPILRWPREFHDAVVEFEMKTSNCQRLVFTLNGDGHVFRIILGHPSPPAEANGRAVASRIIAWATKSSKTNKGDTLKPEGLPDLRQINDQWIKVRLAVRGKTADLTIGDFKTEIEHAALARDKNMVTVSFAFGEFAARNFRMSGTLESVHQMQAKVGDHQLQYLLQTPAGTPPKAGWPMLLFLHGYGECGDDIDKVRVHGPPKLTSRFAELKNCVIVSPQCPKNSWWRVTVLKALMDEVIARQGDIDKSRLYVSGLSMGGYGTWSLLSNYPNYFAAAIPICGGGDPMRLPKNRPPVKQGINNEFEPEGLKQAAGVPIWTFHGTEDGAVPIAETERLVSLLKDAGSDVKFTIYKGAGHVEAWKNAYGNSEVWTWLFDQSKRKD